MLGQWLRADMILPFIFVRQSVAAKPPRIVPVAPKTPHIGNCMDNDGVVFLFGGDTSRLTLSIDKAPRVTHRHATSQGGAGDRICAAASRRDDGEQNGLTRRTESIARRRDEWVFGENSEGTMYFEGPAGKLPTQKIAPDDCITIPP